MMKSKAFIPMLAACCMFVAPAFAQGDGDIRMQEQAQREAERANYLNRLRRGDRIPHDWYGRTYVVENWRAHGLQRPAPGYYWVQSGSDYLLVDGRNGTIRDRVRR